MSPSGLVRRNPQIVKQARDESVAPVPVQIQGPWLGYIPDVAPNVAGPTAAASCSGLQTKSFKLIATDGFAKVDGSSSTLPLGEDNASAAQAPADSGYEQPVVCLGFFPETPTADDKVFAISQKTSATANTHFWVFESSAWTNKAFGGAVGSAPTSTSGLYDYAVYAGGTPAAKTTAGTVTSQVLLFTNNKDRVYKYPRTDANDEIGGLTNDSTLGANFKSRSVEVFQNRPIFLNNEENGTRYYQRLRWGQLGTADPTLAPGTADPGGSVDFYSFGQEGLRALAMGNVLAIYFEDGVAFATPASDFSTLVIRPFSFRVISRVRGPLSTHSVCSVSEDRHFIIANDGWWILDSTGNWYEAGLFSVGADSQKRQRGQDLHKWKATFYSQLSRDNVDNMTVAFDSFRDHVLISWTSVGSSRNNRLWIYDINTDSVWPDDYSNLGVSADPDADLTPTYLSSVNRSVLSGTTWASTLGLETQTLTVTTGSSSAGNVTITTPEGTAVVVALSDNSGNTTDTAAEIADNANLSAFEAAGWVLVSQSAAVVTFWATTEGDKSGTFSLTDTGSTSTAASGAQTRAGSMAGEAWDDQTGQWGGFSPKFGDVIPWHGTNSGQVYYHDPDLATKNGTATSWHFKSHELDWGDPITLKSLFRLYLTSKKRQGTQQVSVEAFSDGGASVTSKTVTLNASATAGSEITSFGDLRHTANHLGWGFSGQGAADFRAFVAVFHRAQRIR